MIKTTVGTLLCCAFLALGGACESTDDAATSEVAELPCTCGTDDAAFHGCAHTLCVAGQTNPDNPDCVCGSIFEEE